MPVKRIEPVLFYAETCAVAANHKPGNSQQGLKQWWIAHSSWIQKWQDYPTSMKTEKSFSVKKNKKHPCIDYDQDDWYMAMRHKAGERSAWLHGLRGRGLSSQVWVVCITTRLSTITKSRLQWWISEGRVCVCMGVCGLGVGRCVCGLGVGRCVCVRGGGAGGG